MLRRRVERLLEEDFNRAGNLIRERIHQTNALVGLLMEREVVLGRDVVQLFRGNSDDQSVA